MFIKSKIPAKVCLFGAAAALMTVSFGAQAQIQPYAQIKLPAGTISQPQSKPVLTAVKTQPNWSLLARSPNMSSTNPIAPGKSASVTVEVTNTREGTLKRAIRLVVGSKADGNYRDFGTFRLDRKGLKRTFVAQVKVPSNFTQGWYKVSARLLEANGRVLADYHGTNQANVSLRVVRPAPPTDPDPVRVSGAVYDWSADTQACNTVSNFISDAWSYMPKVIGAACTGVQVVTNPSNAQEIGKTFRQCTNNASNYTKAVSSGVNEYNKLVGKSTWATLGPRDMRFGIDNKGTVRFPGDRTFVSVVPARKDTLKLRMRELSGKAKVEVIVCKQGERGGIKRLNKTFGFNYSKRSTHDLPRQDESMVIGGVRDEFVTVILKSRVNPALKLAVPKLQYILNVAEHQ